MRRLRKNLILLSLMIINILIVLNLAQADPEGGTCWCTIDCLLNPGDPDCKDDPCAEFVCEEGHTYLFDGHCGFQTGYCWYDGEYKLPKSPNCVEVNRDSLCKSPEK